MTKRDFKDPLHVKWSKAVFRRDKYRCVACGKKNGKYINAHHLNSWDWCVSGRLDVNNGVTLCSGKWGCHTDFHDRYGRGNNTKAQFEEYLLIFHKKVL